MGITDAQLHALVGDGKHGQAERIQTFRCQACHTTFSARRDTPLYRLKTPSQQIAVVRISRWPKGWTLPRPSASSATVRPPSRAFLTRAGRHAELFHERSFRNLHLPHLQLDELRTRLRSATPILWLWLAIDPCTKILPVLHLGPRTQNAAHRVIHSLQQILAPGCVPLFTTDGLNLYFYALTAHFGHWREVGRQGRNVRQWQVVAGLIYGQVRKIYRRRKLIRVTPVIRLGTEDALKAALEGLGLSGRLNTAYIEPVHLTVRDARGGSRKTDLGHFSTGSTASGLSGMVASVVSLCASSPSTPSGARAATRARGQAGGATLPATDSRHGSWQNHPAMECARGARLPLAAGIRLSATEARGGCRVMSRGDG